MAAPEKAFLEVEGGETIPCLFNPEQLQISRSNTWDGGDELNVEPPSLSFVGAGSGELSLDLFFDTTSDGTPVTRYTGKLMGLMDVNPDLPGSDESSLSVRPPYVIFHWGDLHAFKAVVTDLSLSFTYFAASGTPLRARASLTLLQYEPSNAFGPQNPTSGTPKPQRVHRVQSGETLDRIAARYYGDSTRWRTLADANAIGDPLSLRPGSLLSVPRLDS